VKSFDVRGQSTELLRDVAGQFGIRAAIDPSVEGRNIHFALPNVSYERAMYALMTMTDTFAVPVDEKTILIARDTPPNRAQFDRQLQETIDLPGATAPKLQEIANVVRNIFGLKDAVVDASAGRIVIRGPAAVFAPLNRTLEPLMADPGEVLLEIRMYEIESSHTLKAGVKLPTEFTAFNVDQAANQIVSQNQSLVQQAIAQGFVSSTATNLQIALALIGAGLVQSDLAKNLLGVFGGGTLMTGITSPDASLTLNLGRMVSDTRTLDDVQLRVSDQQEATFRLGTRYPITTSTYSTGLSTAASALGNATINGVNVSNLLSQFAGGTSATIPQVTYEDLGLTLKAKPTFQNGGHISMQLDLTIQAVSGSGINNIPVLQNRHFTTSLTVADGESAMLVSDVSKTETAAMTGIPGLSELPGLRAPTERDTEKDSGQLVVLVTPHVVRKRTENAAGPRMALQIAAQ
jgi:type II secretory pathway component GspD/PulD (secretin)